MTIHFYLDDMGETLITSFYDIPSNPFKIGDIIYLDVEDIFPVDYNKYKKYVANQFKIANDESIEKFHQKRIQLISEKKYMRFNILKESQLVIEYHCALVENPN
jgi:hypothetical protein